jgi:hypothetical protein
MTERELDLGLGVLDHQLVDSEGRNCGNVDDLELSSLATEGDVEVTAILVGGNAWRGRGPLGRLLAAFSGDATHLPWSEVDQVSAVVKLRRTSRELRLGLGEDRAARLLERIPGA